MSSGNIFHYKGNSWGYLFLLYLFVQLSRVVVVGVLYPFLCYLGYGLDWKEATILIWSGLRGAVALALSLSVKRTSDSSEHISPEVGTLFVFFTGGIVLLTLIVNGSTAQFILHLLHMDELSATKKRILDYTKFEMLNRAFEAFSDLGDDEDLGPTDWPTVKRHIASLNDVEGGPMHPHPASEIDDDLDMTNIRDIRIRLLNGVQAAYWGMIDEGRISQRTANILMQSVEEAIDLASHEPLCDWKGLKQQVNFPSYYKFLQTGIFPPKLITYFIVQRWESASYICAAFLRAHRIAQRQLHDFIGDSDIASKVINESKAEAEEARKVLDDVRGTFPQVLRVVKTRQVTYSMLNRLIEYVQNLEKIGLLEEKEMLHLHDAVQKDLKRLLRNPPLVPKVTSLISSHHFLGALPSEVREPLEHSIKDMMKPYGVPLYKEGSKPNGVWLISSGTVKWKSKSIGNKHSVNPTFTHGSTLGLYELLVLKPYMCDMVTDSLVLCFFIESDKILSLLSDPAVKDFLWQESAIVLAKLFLPQVFEPMAMQELRAIVAERSIMTTYLSGEIIEVPQHCIGFLLEGFIKPLGFQNELITPPAALFPSHANQSFHHTYGNQSSLNIEMSGARTASYSHQGSVYHVETEARVIIFDIAAFETPSTPQRSSSMVSQSGDHLPRPRSREHGGLMSWPENFYKSKQNEHKVKEDGGPANSLSAKAMQLSIFGSMVDVGWRPSSLPSIPDRGSQSQSLLRATSSRVRPLISVKSEGANIEMTSLGTRQFITKAPALPLPNTEVESHAIDNFSDESGAEDEHIIRIDSPSNLSFRQGS